MVFGWIKRKIRRNEEDEYERIKQSILTRSSESSTFKNFEDEKPPLLERFGKEREISIREDFIRKEPLEPWERERLRREEIKTEWKPIKERGESTIIREREFEPILGRESEVLRREPERSLDIERPSLIRTFEDSERINNRLKFIEEQLATIKAQNEVLIEKLRSIERRLGYV